MAERFDAAVVDRGKVPGFALERPCRRRMHGGGAGQRFGQPHDPVIGRLIDLAESRNERQEGVGGELARVDTELLEDRGKSRWRHRAWWHGPRLVERRRHRRESIGDVDAGRRARRVGDRPIDHVPLQACVAKDVPDGRGLHRGAFDLAQHAECFVERGSGQDAVMIGALSGGD